MKVKSVCLAIKILSIFEIDFVGLNSVDHLFGAFLKHRLSTQVAIFPFAVIAVASSVDWRVIYQIIIINLRPTSFIKLPKPVTEVL